MKKNSSILNIIKSDWFLILIVFAIAFIFRLVYLFEISKTPYFDNPIGDSQIYYDRAKEIMNGNFIGNEIYFHSSPIYPYFMAFFLWLSSNSFFVLILAQIIIGSLNCVLIYFLALRLSDGKKIAALIAGVFASLYGIFAFFDGDLLMIFLTLFFSDLALLLILQALEKKKNYLFLLAGIALGLAALDKTNLLLFVPVGAWFIAGEFSFKWRTWNWKPAVIFIAGVVLMILPMTVRNYIVGKDLVLVSTNGGVNLFIGNNPDADGIFSLPYKSGLSNLDLYGSSAQVAKMETGNSHLKPSEISDFWTTKAWNFIKHNHEQEAKLLWRKFLLLWNYYEIPNHLNYYFIRAEFAPVLNYMFIGFWLIAPLALAGIAWRIWKGIKKEDKLLLSFIIIYIISLLPFFITERYRLPIIPILIIFASIAFVEFFAAARHLFLKDIVFIVIIVTGTAFFVNWDRIHFNYSFARVAIAAKYHDRALKNPQKGSADIAKSIIEFKWAIETDPISTDAHYNLGRVYESIGFYSGAMKEWQITLKIDPNRASAVKALESVKIKYDRSGDKISPMSIPRTPYEEGIIQESMKQNNIALDKYQEVVERDPFHFEAWNNLGYVYFKEGNYNKAIDMFLKGVEVMPTHFILLNNLAGAYYKSGNRQKARETWEKCLKIQPDSDLIKRQLKIVED